MHICIASNSPTLRLCLPSSKINLRWKILAKCSFTPKRMWHPHQVISIMNEVREMIVQYSYFQMLNNGKIDKSHSISNEFTNLSQSTKNKIKNAKSKF